MTFDVLVSKELGNGYIARPLLWPDVVAHGETEQEAIDEVRALIGDLLQTAQIVQVEVDIPGSPESNPWLVKAGLFKDDPTWTEFQAAMADYRKQIDTVLSPD